MSAFEIRFPTTGPAAVAIPAVPNHATPNRNAQPRAVILTSVAPARGRADGAPEV